MTRGLFGAAVSLVVLLCATSTQAATRDDFPSCYGLMDRADLANTAPGRELFVIVDQTVPLDLSLKRSIHSKVHRFLQPGDRFTLLTFSAFAKNRYAAMPLTGKLDFPLDDDTRYRTSIAELKEFDHCMTQQKAYVDHTIDMKLKAALEDASTDLPNTELAGSLARFGTSVISHSAAPKVTVLVVSDMLENSDAATFYSHGQVIPINPQTALQSVQKAGLISDWNGATVYVIGAGLLPGDGYRSAQILHSLENFWADYFKQSDAELAGWGQPDLMTDLQ